MISRDDMRNCERLPLEIPMIAAFLRRTNVPPPKGTRGNSQIGGLIRGGDPKCDVIPAAGTAWLGFMRGWK